MGGRGSSSGSGGTYTAKGKLSLPGDANIEFDGDLKYGKKDPTLTVAQRKAIEEWENRRVKNKIEYATAVTESGIVLGEAKGGKGSVRTPYSWRADEGNTFTHIHPREAGILGGTFSDGDLYNFAAGRSRTTRAKAKEGTYSISKGRNFDRTGFEQMVRESKRNFKANIKNGYDKVRSDMQNGKIPDYGTASKRYAKAFNTALIQLHNEYTANQKKYGYTYTLEK